MDVEFVFVPHGCGYGLTKSGSDTQQSPDPEGKREKNNRSGSPSLQVSMKGRKDPVYHVTRMPVVTTQPVVNHPYNNILSTKILQ